MRGRERVWAMGEEELYRERLMNVGVGAGGHLESMFSLSEVDPKSVLRPSYSNHNCLY